MDTQPEMELKQIAINDLRQWACNPRETDEASDRLAKLISEFGFRVPVIAERDTLKVRSGHTRIQAMVKHLCLDQEKTEKQAMATRIPVLLMDFASESEAQMFSIADNRASEFAKWDRKKLHGILKAHVMDDDACRQKVADMTGFEEVDIRRFMYMQENPESERRSLADEFIVNPFSVLDTHAAAWQQRVKYWNSFGLVSQEGRQENALGLSDTLLEGGRSLGAISPRMKRTRSLTEGEENLSQVLGGTSGFDPVLCEAMYKWFCVPGGTVLDPFAGGVTRGAMATLCGLQYYGMDLNKEQVKANKEQWYEIAGHMANPPEQPIWVAGDSTCDLGRALKVGNKVLVDMVFSSPPYYKVEKYSDDGADLNNVERYDQFMERYMKVIQEALLRLRPGGYFVWVMSDSRKRRVLNYYGTMGEVIFRVINAEKEKYGEKMELVNEIVLVNKFNTLSMRTRKQFVANRLVGRTHQNVLVFSKGKLTQAVKRLGPITFPTGKRKMVRVKNAKK